MWQHLARSDGSIARQAADAAFLSLLFMLLLSGSLIAVLFRWGSSWGVLTLTPYASSLLRGRPAVGLIADMPFLVQLHVFTAFAIVALLPATRIAPILIAGLSRGLRVMSNLLRTSIEPFGGAVEKMARRLNPASRIWPEED
jgi:nitrate reductase gamma subunit